MPKSTFDRAWQRARYAVDMEDVHLHDLRHSAAGETVNAKVDLYTVGADLGHKDFRSTQRNAHLQHGMLAAAVGRLGENPTTRTIRKTKEPPARVALFTYGGEGGIRTHGTLRYA